MMPTASQRHDDMLTTQAEDVAIDQYRNATRAQAQDREGRERSWQNTGVQHNFCSSVWWIVECLEQGCAWSCTDLLTHTYACKTHYAMHTCRGRTCDLLSIAVHKSGTICPVRAVALNSPTESYADEPHYSRETLTYIKSAAGNTRWLDAIIHAANSKTGYTGTLCTRESAKQIRNVSLQNSINSFTVRLLPLIGSFYHTIASPDFKAQYAMQSVNQSNKNIKKQCYKRKHCASHLTPVPYLPITTTKDPTTCQYWHLNVEPVREPELLSSVKNMIERVIATLYNNVFEYTSQTLEEVLQDESLFLNSALMIILCLYNYADYGKYRGRMLFSLLYKYHPYVTEREYTENQNRVTAFFNHNKFVSRDLKHYNFGEEALDTLRLIIDDI